MLGFVPGADLGPLYAGADVFCFPSLLEGFGFPVLEAMAQGTPVVTSRGTSTEELARDGAGVLVDPRDPRSIADGIERALADDGTLAEAGPKRAAEYTWARSADLALAAVRGGHTSTSGRCRICSSCWSGVRCARSQSGNQASWGSTSGNCSARRLRRTKNAFAPRESQPTSA